MNYHDDLNSLFTLIHELGHSMHSTYSKSTQDYLYSSYKIFVAEVASTLNELLLINYLLKKSNSKEEKIYLLNYYLEQQCIDKLCLQNLKKSYTKLLKVESH